MKKIFVLSLVLIMLLALSASVATAGEGDPVPGVEYNPWGVSCGVPTNNFGWFMTYDWWWATYSNGGGILKCITHLADWQTPPAEMIINWYGPCSTPGGSTPIGYTKVFPDGAVHLICKVLP